MKYWNNKWCLPAGIKKRDATDKSEAGGCHVPPRAACPVAWLQKTCSHHKVEIFTAHTLAYGRMKCGWGQLKNDCVCVSRGVLIRFLRLQRHLRTAERKVPSVDLFVARARMGAQPPEQATGSKKITNSKPREMQKNSSKYVTLVTICLRTSVNCKQSLKGPLEMNH